MLNRIIDIKAREIIDSRGNPTIEAECLLESGIVGTLFPGCGTDVPKEAIPLDR